MSDFRTIVRIKNMAQAAASGSLEPGPEEGAEMAAAYVRLRAEAMALHVRAGWGSEEEFEDELPGHVQGAIPELEPGPYGLRTIAMAEALDAPIRSAYEAAARGSRARVLLGQLAGWATGHQEACEIEERMKMDTAARAEELAATAAAIREVGRT